jgi:hypothetical protein
MRTLRWLPRLGPPIAALAAVAVIGSVSHRTAAGLSGPIVEIAALPASCGGATALVAAARPLPPASPPAAAGGAAFVIEPVVDADGVLAGQRVELGTATRVTATLELPPESFAAGPFGQVVLAGSDDGRTSTVRAFDAATACSWSIATETDVIRRATVDPSAGNVYEFRVDRDTRADLGVWREPLAGGAAVRVIPPLAPDDRYGTTFSTELAWSEEGDVLVVQSCGLTSCRTRLLDPVSGDLQSVETADQGEVIGLAAGRLVTYAACRGLPCPIRSLKVATGETSTLSEAAGLARFVETAAGPRLLHETGSGDQRALLLVDPASGASLAISAAGSAWRVVPPPARAGGATSVPPAWALLSGDGRAAGPGDAAELLRLDDGTTLPITEVTQ